MNTKLNEFEKFAVSKGISTNTLDGYFKNQSKVLNLMEPYILEERELNVASMSVLSRLFYDRIIFLASDVTADSANIIKAQLLFLNSNGDDDIKFFIDTCGGEVISGLAVIDVMNFVKPDVQTYCMGMCASMGAVILSSGTNGKRFSLPHGEIMIHQIRSASSGVFADMKIDLQHSERLQNTLYGILAENTGKSIEQISADANRDMWFTADEAKDYGLIDSIIKTSK